MDYRLQKLQKVGEWTTGYRRWVNILLQATEGG